MTPTDWQPYREHFERSLTTVEPGQREEMLRLGMAPFASDPDRTLHPADLMVVSMKPYGAPGKQYASGWEERAAVPGLHRWYDGARSSSNFVREADVLLRGVITSMNLKLSCRDVFNVYAYFYRAADADQLRKFGLTTVDCSVFHHTFLGRVAPRVVLCIGNGGPPSAFATYCGLFPDAEVTTIRVAPRVLVRYFNTVTGLRVIGVPHLSYVRAEQLLPTVMGLV